MGALTISGARYPSKKEQKILATKVFNFARNYPHVVRHWTDQDFIRAVLKVGSNQFGKFSVAFQLPQDLDGSRKIEADYKRGVLYVDVPRLQRAQRYPNSVFSTPSSFFDDI